jgi:Kef-type K+ transport system membrane component KefB
MTKIIITKEDIIKKYNKKIKSCKFFIVFIIILNLIITFMLGKYINYYSSNDFVVLVLIATALTFSVINFGCILFYAYYINNYRTECMLEVIYNDNKKR